MLQNQSSNDKGMHRRQIVEAGCLWSFLFLLILVVPILCLAIPVKRKISKQGFVALTVVFCVVWLYATLQILSHSFMEYKRRSLGDMCIEFFKQKPDDLNVWADYGLLLGLHRDKNIVKGDTDLDLNVLKSQRGGVMKWLENGGLKGPLYYDKRDKNIYHRRNPFKIDIEDGVDDDDPFIHKTSTLKLRGFAVPTAETPHKRLTDLYGDYWVSRPFSKSYEPDKWRRLAKMLHQYLGIRF